MTNKCVVCGEFQAELCPNCADGPAKDLRKRLAAAELWKATAVKELGDSMSETEVLRKRLEEAERDKAWAVALLTPIAADPHCPENATTAARVLVAALAKE